MSHLINKVNNSSLSSLNIEDFSNINVSSLSNNDVFSYNDSNSKYENTQASSVTSEDNKGASFGYATTSPGVGGNANVYNTTTIPFIRFYYYGAAPSTQRQFENTNYTTWPQRVNYNTWSYFSGIYVPAGTHKVKCTIHGNHFASSSECVFRFCKGPVQGTSPTTSNTTFVGPHFKSAVFQGRFSSIPMAIITTTNATTFIGLRCVSATSVSLSSVAINALMHIETL